MYFLSITSDGSRSLDRIITTLYIFKYIRHAHKNTCTDLKWNQFNGNWLVSSSKDHLCKLFDIRNLKEEVQTFRGHKKDACSKIIMFQLKFLT